ncbi:MAG: glutaredoxin domain-containing protein [Thiomonas sp.]|uniref:glutaredoxin domain-containing protein n=1 Tax=Thiomonas sp. TaxID=2047785 RepID=UPI002A35B332|nr:glutaredoxin domain-containing protein [Thiomonas sp.]MDY0330715.1 glutaredoxin domain-containing protein [Thiomonas sp.]
MKRLTKRPLRHALAFSAALASTLAAGTPAWAIYKIVGPDGSVTFSDVPPSNTQGKAVQSLSAGNSAAPDRFAGFPAALREAARKYPVTLYTAPQCEACDAARDYLIQRGIPFAEKTITTHADIKAYKTLSNGSDQLPLLIIGSTKLNTGFSSSNWDIALDAAGYPKKSELPRGYVRPQPAALAPAPAKKASAPETKRAPTEPSVLPPPNPNAPKGFQF